MNFDEPMTKDPLLWVGLVVGAVWGVVTVIANDLTGVSALLTLVTSVVATTWVGAGILAATVRELYRHRRDRRAYIDVSSKKTPS